MNMNYEETYINVPCEKLHHYYLCNRGQQDRNLNDTQGAQTAYSNKDSADKSIVQTADCGQQPAVQRDSKEMLVKYIGKSTYGTEILSYLF